MRSPSVAMTGTQQPAVLHLPADVHSHDAADEALELADAYMSTPDESQRLTIRAWMGTRADGTWAARDCGHAMSRQNGKGDELQIRELYGLVAVGETIIHTAHELPTAVNAFNRLVATFEAWDDLRRLVAHVRYANGEQGIQLLSGAEIKYRARTGGGSRGFDDIGVVVYDEAQHLKPEHVAASSPTMAVHPNPQLILTGSAGLSFSDVWWGYRLAALRGDAKRLAYVEHTAEQCWIDDKGAFKSSKPNVEDRQAWADANPAYNVRIPDEFLEAQLRALGAELFAREHLGVWDPLPSMLAQQGAVIPEGAWLDAVTVAPPVVQPGDLAMSFDVEVDASFSAISIASGTLADGFVQTIEHRPGAGWLPSRLVELVQAWKPTKIVMDGSSGPAAAALGEVRYEFDRAGIDAKVLEPLPTSAYKAACASFLQAVVDGKVHRAAVDNDRLERAGLTARSRDIGDAWVFDRRNSPDPIVALTTAAMARSVLIPEPAFKFFLQ